MNVITFVTLTCLFAITYALDDIATKNIQVETFFKKNPAVTQVDLDAYYGLWYEVYANPIVSFTFQLGGRCVTANYAKNETSGKIDVVNKQVVKRFGKSSLQSIQGTAVSKTLY